MLRSSIGRMVGMLLGVALLPLSAQATAPQEPAWILNPDTVAADRPFVLEVLSYRYSCAHEVFNKKVQVSGNRIDLTFFSRANPAMLCPAIYKPYGPKFDLPALPTGRYTVVATLLQPCHVDSVAVCASIPPRETVGTLVVGAPDESIGYFIDPTTVRAGVEFTLNLLSPDFTCNLEYSMQAATVQDGRITLTFLDKPNPLVRCAPERKAYGPAYKLMGLEAGSYAVWAARLPACAEQGCKRAAILDSVGRLTVLGDTPARKGWFLKQKEVNAGSPFTLGVVNHAYGNCNTGFEHSSLVVGERAITVSFVRTSHPERVCIQDVRPHGPDFQVGSMRPGRYPLFVHELPACAFSQPRCEIDVLLNTPPADDTLFVAEEHSLGVLGGDPFVSAPQAAWRDGALRLRLPDAAAGAWRAEVFDLSGKRLHAARFDARKGADLRGIAAPGRSLVLVRLRGPGAGESHLLRVPTP